MPRQFDLDPLDWNDTFHLNLLDEREKSMH